MPREKIYAKDIAPRGEDGMPLEFHEGIQQREYTESEFKALPDEHQVTLAGSCIFDLSDDAKEAAAAAAKRLESGESVAEPAPPVADPVPVPDDVPSTPLRVTSGRRSE